MVCVHRFREMLCFLFREEKLAHSIGPERDYEMFKRSNEDIKNKSFNEIVLVFGGKTVLFQSKQHHAST